MPDFIPGLELCRLFFEEAVRPVLDAEFPSLRYAAALLGTGSGVLGFDDTVSTDHCRGPRLDLFLEEEADEALRADVNEALRRLLPREQGTYHPDPRVRRLAGRRLLGGLDQFSDSTDLVSDASWRATLRRLHE